MQQNVVHWNETQEVCMNIFARNVDEKFNTVKFFSNIRFHNTLDWKKDLPILRTNDKSNVLDLSIRYKFSRFTGNITLQKV